MTYPLPTRRWFGFLAAWLLSLSAALAQGPVGFGDWQLHLPTNQAKALADTGPRVYVATENSFFYFDKELNTTRLLSRRDGLNDVGVSTVAYDSVSQQLLIVYNNGNLDVLRANGAIQNVTDILRASVAQTKTINQVQFSGRAAYLASSFGLLVFDMTRLEVRDTYVNIGPGGQAVQVYASAVLRDSVYAATSAGLLRGRLTDNLANFRNWTTDLPARAGNPFRTLATQAGYVYAGANGDQLYRFGGSGRGWLPVPGFAGGQFRELASSPAGLLVTETDKLTVLTRPGGNLRTYRNALLRDVRAALRSRDGAFYLADFQSGLVKATNEQQFENFVTNAPASVRAFSVYSDARTGITNVFSGGFSDRFLQSDFFGGFYEYQDGRWTNITPQTIPNRAQYPNPKDLTRGVRTPDGTLYVGSYGNGVLEWKGPGSFRQFTDGTGNNPLKTALAPPKFPNFDPNYTRITDLTADAEGNVWVVNRHEFANTPAVHIFNPVASTWRSVPYFSGAENLSGIVLDDSGHAWLSTSRQPAGNGVIGYDETTRTPRYFSKGNGLPSDASNDIYDMVKDRQGSIWVTTSNGVVVLTDPSQAFVPGAEVAFQLPLIQRGPPASRGFPALRDEVVRAVAVDGANRKWFGTDRGLWLFSESADEALLNFTTANSPLPSNRILDIALNDRTGEVFVVTDAGVVSYRGSATVTEGKPTCAKVFPNPVRTDFMGQVGISGLANNAVVKITDVGGRLVYQTRANGGTLVWNLADYNGRKVQSGVYLVLSSDPDGKNTCISKIAVVAR